MIIKYLKNEGNKKEGMKRAEKKKKKKS